MIILPRLFIYLLLWKYLNPIVIRVIDEIQPHSCILETYTIHFFMISSDGIIVTGHPKTKMTFILSKFIWSA